jgi:hypothetical protein
MEIDKEYAEEAARLRRAHNVLMTWTISSLGT